VVSAADFQGRARELTAWARDEFGTVTTGVYGSSEVFALTALWPAGEPTPHRWDGGGRVVHDGVRVRVVDPASGEPCPLGADGARPAARSRRAAGVGARGRWPKVPGTVHVIDAMPTTSGTNGTKIRAAVLRQWAARWR
jgi:hypothetical protein